LVGTTKVLLGAWEPTLLWNQLHQRPCPQHPTSRRRDVGTGKIKDFERHPFIERGVSTSGLARRLLFFSRRRRRFVLGTRRALMHWLRRPLTLCRSLMMSGRRGWPALCMRRSRMRRGSRPRFRRSRACMLSRYGPGRLGFSLGRTSMRRGSGLGFRVSRIRVCGSRGPG